MTTKPLSDNRGRMGRKKLWDEDIDARFVLGTKARIKAVITETERDFSAFVRVAVEAELQRREAEVKRLEGLQRKAGTGPGKEE